MKQEIVTYLSTIKDDIHLLSKYLYENPEEGYKEYKCKEYIINILKKHEFTIETPLINIDTAFFAQFGNTHPKICFLCEYDAIPNRGHIAGHNLITSISVASALSLAKIVTKIGGSVILIGCPGEFKTGSKVTMAKQGVFDDMDVVMMAHPDIITAESGKSMAVVPLKISYKSEEGFAYRKHNKCSALDAMLLTFNTINLMSNCFDEDTSIDKVILKGGELPYLLPSYTDARIYIRCSELKKAEAIEQKIRQLVKTIGDSLNVEAHTCLFELPYENLKTNKVLSRIFSHNLKESGIIDVQPPKDTNSGLSLGALSHKVPCIHPYISIVEDNNIKYSSEAFAHATISPFAQDKVMKVAQALTCTAIDLIENENLLREVTTFTFNKN